MSSQFELATTDLHLGPVPRAYSFFTSPIFIFPFLVLLLGVLKLVLLRCYGCSAQHGIDDHCKAHESSIRHVPGLHHEVCFGARDYT